MIPSVTSAPAVVRGSSPPARPATRVPVRVPATPARPVVPAVALAPGVADVPTVGRRVPPIAVVAPAAKVTVLTAVGRAVATPPPAGVAAALAPPVAAAPLGVPETDAPVEVVPAAPPVLGAVPALVPLVGNAAGVGAASPPVLAVRGGGAPPMLGVGAALASAPAAPVAVPVAAPGRAPGLVPVDNDTVGMGRGEGAETAPPDVVLDVSTPPGAVPEVVFRPGCCCCASAGTASARHATMPATASPSLRPVCMRPLLRVEATRERGAAHASSKEGGERSRDRGTCPVPPAGQVQRRKRHAIFRPPLPRAPCLNRTFKRPHSRARRLRACGPGLARIARAGRQCAGQGAASLTPGARDEQRHSDVARACTRRAGSLRIRPGPVWRSAPAGGQRAAPGGGGDPRRLLAGGL